MRNHIVKKALVLCEVFHPEDFLINDLVQEWEKKGYELEVLTRVPSYPFGKVYNGYKNKIYQTTSYGSIKVHRVSVCQGYHKSSLIKILNYFTFVFWTFWVVLFIGKRFDRVFIYQTGPLTLATTGILMKKLFKSKVILWTQDLWPETVYAYGFKKTKLLSLCLDKFVKWIYTNCDTILMSCNGFKDSIKQYYPQAQCVFMPNWSLINYEPKDKLILPGHYNFTFAGNIGKVQNLDNVVLGFKSFVKTYPNVWLNIIGDGSYLSELKQLVKTEQIPNINFTGRVPLSKMSDYYEASDVLLLSLKDVPLYRVMIPSKFQTYLSTGKPIYAIFKGEVRDIVEKNNIGYGAVPDDISEIAHGFKKFLDLSENENKTMAMNAINLSSSTFSKDHIINHINSILWI